MVDITISSALTQAAAGLQNPRPVGVVPPAVAGFIPTPFDPAANPTTRIEAAARLYTDAYHDLLSPTAPTIPGTDRVNPVVSRIWKDVAITVPRQNTIVDGFALIGAHESTEVFSPNGVFNETNWSAVRASIALVRGGVEALFPDRDDLRQVVTLQALQIWRTTAETAVIPSDPNAIGRLVTAAANGFIREVYWKRITETVRAQTGAIAELPTEVRERIGHQLCYYFTPPATLTNDQLEDAAVWAESILNSVNGDSLAARTTLARILIDGRHRDAFEQLPADQQTHILSIVATEIGQDATSMLRVTDRALSLRNLLRKPAGRLTDAEIEQVLAVITYGQEPLDFTVVPEEQRKPLKVAIIAWTQTEAWADADAVTMADHAKYRQRLLAPTREKLSLYVPAQALGAEVVTLHGQLTALLDDPTVVAEGSDALRDLINEQIGSVVDISEALGGDISAVLLARIRGDLLARQIGLADLEALIEERRVAIEAAADAAAAGGDAGGGNGGGAGGGAPDDGDDGAPANAGPGPAIV